MSGVIFLLVVVALAVYAVMCFNRLIALRNGVESAWAQIDVQLNRRHDLIPNLVETVKGMSDRIALVMSGARPAPPEEYAQLHNLVEGLCLAGGLPKPAVYVVQDDAPNAFATGRDPEHAAIAVTTGLLAKLNRAELEGVLAHELAHIRNYDTLVSTLAVTMVGAARGGHFAAFEHPETFAAEVRAFFRLVR